MERYSLQILHFSPLVQCAPMSVSSCPNSTAVAVNLSVGCAQTLHRRKINFLLEMHKNERIQIWYSSNAVEAERTLSESSLFTMWKVLVLFSCIYLDTIKYSCISLGHKVHLAGASWYSFCKTCLCLEERLLQIGFPTVSQNMGFFHMSKYSAELYFSFQPVYWHFTW